MLQHHPLSRSKSGHSDLRAHMAGTPVAAVPKVVSKRMGGTVSFRRPQCTHITVDRAYGDLTCSMCGRASDLGWVYRCRQDSLPSQHEALPDLDTVPMPHALEDFYEAYAQIADYLRLGRSVIDGIRGHQYSYDQINKLIKQKQHVIKLITDVESHLDEAQAPPSPPSANVIASAGVTGGNAQQEVDAMTMENNSAPKAAFACPFQVCHTCRPVFYDRMHASFEAILNNEVPQPIENDPHQRPLMDPLVMSTIGLRQPPVPLQTGFDSDRSADIASQYLDDHSDEISVDWTPTTTGAESDASDEHVDSSELYPCPGPGQCPVWSRYSGCAYDKGFDDGRRAFNHGYLAAQFSDRLTPENSRSRLSHLFGGATDTPGGASSTASSISLPTPATSMFASLLPTDDTFDVALQKQLAKAPRAKSATGQQTSERIDSPLLRQQSTDSFGSEIEVCGGVALTEEAVRNNSPDILTMS